MDFFVPNGEWEVIGFLNRRHILYFSGYPQPVPDVTYYLIIWRKHLYYRFNLILPCIFITATTILVFYLPEESGEKVLTIVIISYLSE